MYMVKLCPQGLMCWGLGPRCASVEVVEPLRDGIQLGMVA
jgi:hypothetical protein